MAATPSPIRLSAPTSPGEVAAITLEFRWSVDRFGHRIEVAGQTVAESIDGHGGQDWPPSPPLQQLSLEEIDGRPTLLGVGSAGRCHWSVSVASLPTSIGCGFVFEWACRVKGLADPSTDRWLGSTYRIDRRRTDPQIFAPLGETRHEFDASGPEVILRPPALEATTCWRYRAALPGGQ